MATRSRARLITLPKIITNEQVDQITESITKMIVLEYKLKGKSEQFRRIDDAIRTAQFIRNKCIRLCMERAPRN